MPARCLLLATRSALLSKGTRRRASTYDTPTLSPWQPRAPRWLHHPQDALEETRGYVQEEARKNNNGFVRADLILYWLHQSMQRLRV